MRRKSFHKCPECSVRCRSSESLQSHRLLIHGAGRTSDPIKTIPGVQISAVALQAKAGRDY